MLIINIAPSAFCIFSTRLPGIPLQIITNHYTAADSCRNRITDIIRWRQPSFSLSITDFVFVCRIIRTPPEKSKVSIGTLTASFVHPREIFTEALKYPCAAIVLIHNHPSGDSSPSTEDIKVTHKLVNCGKTMEIPIVYHVIIGDNTYYSMKEHGYIRK